MTSRTIATLPFNCCWIAGGSEGRIEAVAYAICRRVPDQPRVVSEFECEWCPLWQERPEVDVDRAPA